MTNIQKSTIAFINLLRTFECKKELDPYWQIIFPLKETQWKYLHISEYQNIFYVNEIIGGSSLEIDPNHTEFDSKEWSQLFLAAINWLKKAEKNWIQANKIVFEQFPLKYRKGIVPSAVVAGYFPEYKHLQEKLGIRNARKMLLIIDQAVLKGNEAGITERLTAGEYFEYCKLAYQAVGLVKTKESGKEAYKKFADGRHEGLLEIDPNSEKEFAAWIDGKHPKKEIGGHPWEILRGGNTSNIQLNVRRPMYGDKEKFKVEVYATGISRLAESIKIFLEIHNAGKPIAIQEPDTIREQLLLLDNIGILPEYSSLHRGIQAFEKSQNVNDVAFLSNFKKHASKRECKMNCVRS